MNQPIADFRAAITRALTGRSVAGTATESGLPRDAIRNVLLGHDPRMSRADEICRAVAITFTIGLHRDDPTTAKAAQTPVSAPRTGTVPVADRQLAELLARLTDHWETIGVNDRARLAAAVAAMLDLVHAKGPPSLQRAVEQGASEGLYPGLR